MNLKRTLFLFPFELFVVIFFFVKHCETLSLSLSLEKKLREAKSRRFDGDCHPLSASSGQNASLVQRATDSGGPSTAFEGHLQQNLPPVHLQRSLLKYNLSTPTMAMLSIRAMPSRPPWRCSTQALGMTRSSLASPSRTSRLPSGQLATTTQSRRRSCSRGRCLTSQFMIYTQ